MSEKEVRQEADNLILEVVQGNTEMAIATAQVLDEALSEPPDVVVLLRKLKKTIEAIPGNTPADRMWISGIETVILRIEKIVRLTADGWEWVEDGE